VSEPFKDIEDARALAQAIVDTVREPLLVLDGDLRVLAVSRSYYLTFQVNRQDVLGRPLYALGDGQWHIPALRTLLEKIIQEPPWTRSRSSMSFPGLATASCS
jgi:PAS domain-containing protein